ncbi:relaxase/mobilization nuclease domain-containing protein [Vreelandella neptunia]|jgi:hypothetical protein|uniref:Relaxase/mobilization nuclease domain-containing protein n=1 Tax=Vreelandella neptunia TaxID=115551 RepID=A0ABS9SAH0_9GAMM|nr:relaxase/mobilization nuclease domain-containing protein [Halomonas neptunia]MCH4813118.1 relaxase/mobilization nuclease domain-containing protein [Halomonas neptunia]
MIFRYFPYGSKTFALKCRLTGNRGGFNAVDYVRGNKDHEGHDRKVLPELMKGDSDLMVNILDEGKYANEYVSGVLRFTERDLSKDFLHKIIEEHERMSLPGLEPHQYASLWYLHRDKDDIELHFIYSKEELTTGKKLAPYVYYKMGSKDKNWDYSKMDHWQNAINAEYNLGDPKHPYNRQIISEADIRLPEPTAKSKEGIDEEIYRRIKKGVIQDRETLLSELENIEGVIEVSRVTKKSISVKVKDRKAPIRLKGTIYEEGFVAENLTASFSTNLEKEAEAYDADRENRAKRERAEAEKIYRYQAKVNKEKFKPNEGKVLKAEFYALIDDKILAGELTSRKQIVEHLKAQDKVVEVVDTHKHHISIYYEGGARPFRMEGEPYQREGSIDNYLNTLLGNKADSDQKIEERRREEEEYYFSREFGKLDFVRLKDTRWNEFAKSIDNMENLKEHLSSNNDIIVLNQNTDNVKSKIEANSDMTEFDLSIFRAYAEDPHFEIKENKNNHKEKEYDTDNKADRQRAERIIRELVTRQPKKSLSKYFKDTFDGIKGAIQHFSRSYRRSFENLRSTRRKIVSSREKSASIDEAFKHTISNFEREVLALQERRAKYQPESKDNGIKPKF